MQQFLDQARLPQSVARNDQDGFTPRFARLFQVFLCNYHGICDNLFPFALFDRNLPKEPP